MLIYIVIGFISALAGGELYLIGDHLGAGTGPAIIMIITGVITVITAFITAINRDNKESRQTSTPGDRQK